MLLDTDDLRNSIESSFERMRYINADDIPSIDLYMDQVTTFLDEELKHSSRIMNDEKLMTKTMINNYAKNEVIPPPVRKKYTKEHMLVLTMLFYFKSFLQISDIKELFDPLTVGLFGKNGEFGIEDVYNSVFEDVGKMLPSIHDDVLKKFDDSLSSFEDAPEEEREYLKLYSFVCKLGCDVFIKKLMIEKIVDSLREHKSSEEVKEENSSDRKSRKSEKAERRNQKMEDNQNAD